MESQKSKYERATKRVKELKGFYNHLKIFVLFNGLLYLMRSGILHSILPEDFPVEPYYFDWVHVNLLIWGVILLVHALVLYRHKFKFAKKWEERQIQKYMDKEQDEVKRYK